MKSVLSHSLPMKTLQSSKGKTSSSNRTKESARKKRWATKTIEGIDKLMLKQLKIQKAIEIKRNKLKELETKMDAVLKRSEDAKKALEESETEEDIKTVEATITQLKLIKLKLKLKRKTLKQKLQILKLNWKILKNVKHKQIRKLKNVTKEKVKP